MIRKIGLIIFGVSLVVLFEFSLSLVGKIYLYATNLDLLLHKKEFTKQILCLGDSYTFGVETSYKYSYPKQLQTLLNLNNPKVPFSVINLGIPGDNTRHQIERLAAYLNKNRVDLVILLTGANNYYEVKLWKNKSFLTSVIVKIKKTRIYRIMQYILWRFLKTEKRENLNAPSEKTKYENYMQYHLNRAKSLCEKHGCELLLISYPFSYIEYIEKFVKKSGILYFNLKRGFYNTIPSKDPNKYISYRSHLNLYGYNIFAELLYKQMFLHRVALDIKLNPLTKKINKDSFPKRSETNYLKYVLGKSIFY